jgi:hypothetical protein
MVESTLLRNINDVFKAIRVVNLTENDLPSLLNSIVTDMICVFTSKERRLMWECFVPPCFVWDVDSMRSDKVVGLVLKALEFPKSGYLWVFDTDDVNWLDDVVDGIGLFDGKNGGLNLSNVVFENSTFVFSQTLLESSSKLPTIMCSYVGDDEMLKSIVEAQTDCYLLLDGDTNYPHYFIEKTSDFDSAAKFNDLWVFSINASSK